MNRRLSRQAGIWDTAIAHSRICIVQSKQFNTICFADENESIPWGKGSNACEAVKRPSRLTPDGCVSSKEGSTVTKACHPVATV